MKFNRRRLSIEEKRRVVVEYEKGNDTLKECARKAGVGQSTLSLWRRQYSDGGGGRLLEVDVAPAVAAARGGNYRVTLPEGMSVEFGKGFETSELRNVLEIIRELR